VRCVACGEVHWNLRLAARADSVQECRLCGAELRPEAPRRPARRFAALKHERPKAPVAAKPVGLGPSAAS
jgi:hypothetical protein